MTMLIEQQLINIFEAYSGPRPVVFCDVDEVLANFREGVQQTFPDADLSTYPKLRSFLKKRESWELLKTENPHIFRNLPVMDGANELMKGLLNLKKLNYISLEFLTAYPEEWRNDEEMKYISINDKHHWLLTHFPFVHKSDIHVCLRTEKPSYGVKAFKETGIRPLLIDDMKINIEHWRYEGFQGIVYLNPKQALSEVKQYLTVMVTDALKTQLPSINKKRKPR